MPRSFRIAYVSHAVRSDWNNGNAHFVRGLLRALGQAGHFVQAIEPAAEWSIDNLHGEAEGAASLQQFNATYPDLNITRYTAAETDSAAWWRSRLQATDFVLLHEWNEPALAHRLLALREELGFRLLFHDTHHRASSSPEQMERFGLERFDGVLAFGEALRTIYRERFGFRNVWTLHEAADTTVFFPRPQTSIAQDVVWIGNWGEGERSGEIRRFLLEPAQALPQFHFAIHGVRYPKDGVLALTEAGVAYRGYLPNLQAPAVYAASRLTVHVPRQQYTGAMTGIPTIRVFEALASGIPLVSAPWQDAECLFRAGDFLFAESAHAMTEAMRFLLTDTAAAHAQAQRGLETVLARHTCRHRAEELSAIFEELAR